MKTAVAADGPERRREPPVWLNPATTTTTINATWLHLNIQTRRDATCR